MLLHADRGSLFLVQGERKCAGDNSQRSDSSNSLVSNNNNNNTSKPNNNNKNNNNHNTNNNNNSKTAGKSKSTGADESEGDNLSPPKLTRPRSRCLVSKLFDVCSRSTLVEMEKNDEIKIPWGTGIVGFVAESGEPVNIPDAYMVIILFFIVLYKKLHC